MYTFYTSRFRPIKFLALLRGKKFSVDINNKAIRYYSGIFVFIFLQVLVIWSFYFVCDCSQGYSECMRKRGQVDLHPFDPEPERTLHRLRRELRTAQNRNLAIMQNNEEQDLGHEQNEPQRDRNGNHGRNHAPRLFIQPDDPFMLLEEFALPPTVVQTAIRRPPI